MSETKPPTPPTPAPKEAKVFLKNTNFPLFSDGGRGLAIKKGQEVEIGPVTDKDGKVVHSAKDVADAIVRDAGSPDYLSVEVR